MYDLVINLWANLWPNLLAEAISILVTVLLINQLIKWRENRTWRPATQFFFFELFIITKKLMATLAPDRPLDGNVCEYKFGDNLEPLRAVPSKEFAKGRLENAKTRDFIAAANKVIRERPRFLPEYRQRLSILLSQSQGILAREPKLMELVSKLYEQLRYVADEVDERRGSADAACAQVDERLASDFEKVAREAYCVRQLLERHRLVDSKIVQKNVVTRR
jgi:hypothetical protein